MVSRVSGSVFVYGAFGNEGVRLQNGFRASRILRVSKLGAVGPA